MFRKTAFLILFVSAFVALPVAQQAEKLDYAAIGQIRDEGLNRSQVMDTLFWLTDRYGPRAHRLAGVDDAGAWTMKKMTDWGLANVHREECEFGRSWSIVRFSAHMIEPQIQPLIGLPKTWSAGTDGPVTADVVRTTHRDRRGPREVQGAAQRKDRAGAAVRAVRMLEGPFIVRMDGDLTKEAETTPIPAQRGRGGRGGRGAAAAAGAGGRRAGGRRRRGDQPAGRGGAAGQFQQRLQQFYKDEGVVAVFDRGSDADTSNMGSDLSVNQQRPDGGTIFPGTGEPHGARERAAGDAGRRALQPHGAPARAQRPGQGGARRHASSSTTTPKGFNIVGEIPGHRPRERGRHARRALRLAFVRDRRDRQRDRQHGDAGGAPHHQDARPQAAPDDPRRAVGRRGAGAARIAGLRAGALRRSADDAAEAGAREARGLLQPGQRHRARSAGSGCRATSPRGRSSSSGSRR